MEYDPTPIFWGTVIVLGIALIVHRGKGDKPNRAPPVQGAYFQMDPELSHAASDHSKEHWTTRHFMKHVTETKDRDAVIAAQDDSVY